MSFILHIENNFENMFAMQNLDWGTFTIYKCLWIIYEGMSIYTYIQFPILVLMDGKRSMIASYNF